MQISKLAESIGVASIPMPLYVMPSVATRSCFVTLEVHGNETEPRNFTHAGIDKDVLFAWQVRIEVDALIPNTVEIEGEDLTPEEALWVEMNQSEMRPYTVVKTMTECGYWSDMLEVVLGVTFSLRDQLKEHGKDCVTQAARISLVGTA